MSKSHPFQRARLFDGLVKRYHKKLPSMSLQALALAYGFENVDQVRHALEMLVETRHITGTFVGRHPTIHIWKDRYRTVQMRSTPMNLLPPGSDTAANKLAERIAPPAPPAQTFTILPARPRQERPDYVATVEQISKEVADQHQAVLASLQGLYEPLPEIVAPVETVERVCEPVAAICDGYATIDVPAAPKPKIPARFVRIAMARKVDPIDMILELAGQYLDIVGDNFDLKCGAHT